MAPKIEKRTKQHTSRKLAKEPFATASALAAAWRQWVGPSPRFERAGKAMSFQRVSRAFGVTPKTINSDSTYHMVQKVSFRTQRSGSRRVGLRCKIVAQTHATKRKVGYQKFCDLLRLPTQHFLTSLSDAAFGSRELVFRPHGNMSYTK